MPLAPCLRPFDIALASALPFVSPLPRRLRPALPLAVLDCLFPSPCRRCPPSRCRCPSQHRLSLRALPHPRPIHLSLSLYLSASLSLSPSLYLPFSLPLFLSPSLSLPPAPLPCLHLLLPPLLQSRSRPPSLPLSLALSLSLALYPAPGFPGLSSVHQLLHSACGPPACFCLIPVTPVSVLRPPSSFLHDLPASSFLLCTSSPVPHPPCPLPPGLGQSCPTHLRSSLCRLHSYYVWPDPLPAFPRTSSLFRVPLSLCPLPCSLSRSHLVACA